MPIKTIRMLRAVALANARLDALGLSDVAAIVYTRGAARLLTVSGLELVVVEGPPARSCGLVAGVLERSLYEFFMSDPPS